MKADLNFKEADWAREAEREKVGHLPGAWGKESLQLRNKDGVGIRQARRQELLQGKKSRADRSPKVQREVVASP